jgi:predicted lipoprotein with Yx(FWY)xxD motif
LIDEKIIDEFEKLLVYKKMENEMKQSKLSKVTGLSTFFAILALILAACAPAPAAAPTAAPTAAIPVAAATNTPMPQPSATMAPVSAATVLVKNDPKLGDYLVDAKGMTLYLFTKDTAGVSNCSGGCLKAWPPLVATGDLVAGPGVTGKLGTITRSDGTKQVTYNDMPLYYWASDMKPGDITGQGVGGVWYVVPPTKPASSGGNGY